MNTACIRFPYFKISATSKTSHIHTDLYSKLKCEFRIYKKQYRVELVDVWLDTARILDWLDSVWLIIFVFDHSTPHSIVATLLVIIEAHFFVYLVVVHPCPKGAQLRISYHNIQLQYVFQVGDAR